MQFFTNRLHTVSALFIFFFLLTASRSSAQGTVDTGRESAKASINMTDLSNYYLAHPPAFLVKETENEDDDVTPVRPPADPARIRTMLSTYIPTTYLPVSPSPTDTFESTLDNGTSIPPDTHGAVDSNYCMTTINSGVHIQTRAGVNVSSVSLDAFWTSLVGGGTYDPRIHYDPYYHRWIFITDAGAQSAASALLIGVSKTSNPTGGWWLYKVMVSVPGYWLDYPNVGFNKNWVVVTGNLFQIVGSGSGGNRVYAFNYASLMSGAGAPYTAFTQATSQCIAPTLTYDPTLESIFCIESWNGGAGGGGQMQLWQIKGAVGSETMTSIGFPASAGYNWQSQGNGGSDFAPQLGSGGLIQTNDDRVFSAQYINSRLWCAHNVFSPSAGPTTRCSVQWWQMDTFGTPTQIGLIDDPTNNNFFSFPSIAVNSNNDALIGFTQFSANTHPDAAYALHVNTDPANSTRPFIVYRHGQSTYFKNFGGPRDRWGDYSGTNVDPLNMTDFWTIQETVASTNTWDTWWAYVNMCNIVATITPSGPTTFCAGSSVTLTGTSGLGYTYQWQLGGSPIAGATNISYTASATGNYTVIITSGCSATSPVTAVSVNPLPAPIGGSLSVCVSGTTNLTDASGPGTWSSGTPAVATVVPATGVVSGVAAGTSNITFTLGTGCNIAATVTVSALPAAIGGTLNVCVGGTTNLTDASGPGTWSSGTPAVATVVPATGVVSGVTAGTSVITFTSGTGCYITATVTVNPAPTAITSSSGFFTVCSGLTVTLNSTPAGGAWTTSNPAVATVSGGGVVTGVGTGGLANITYTVSGCYAMVVMTVNSTVAAPITGPSSVCTGQTISLTDATPGGTWSSTNPAAATIGTSGVVTGVGSGTTTISYVAATSCGTATATATITDNPAPLVAAIAGATFVCTGGTDILTDATISGVWSSSNPAVATIGSSSGIATGVSVGAASMSYTVTNGFGCATSSLITLNVFSSFTATITPAGPTSFCTGGYVLLNATTGTGYTYKWYKSGTLIPGVTTAAYTANTSGNYTVLVTAPGGCNSLSSGVFVNVNPSPIVVPSVNIAASPGIVMCLAISADTFTAIPSGGGLTPTYQWFINGASVGTGNTYNYTPVVGDVVRVVMSSSDACAFPVTAIKTDTIQISPLRTPSVSIIANKSPICAGDTVKFSAVPSYGGTAPTFLWTQNGINVATGPDYIYVPVNGDHLYVTMTSNFSCVTTNIAVSGTITVPVYNHVVNTLTVTVSQSSIVSGSVDTFTAIAPNGGSSPAFQWLLNGVSIPGANSSVYITNTLAAGQVIGCIETSSAYCAVPKTVASSGITVRVIPVGVQQITNNSGNYTLLPNPNKGAFTIEGKLNEAADTKVSIDITDMLGQAIYTRSVVATSGNLNETITLDNAVANGMYLVSITSKDGREVYHVVVNR